MLSTFSYTGSKYKELSKVGEIIRQNESSILEPFCGSAVTTMRYGSEGSCHINDFNRDIADIWKAFYAQDPYFLAKVTELCDEEKRKDEKRYYALREEYNVMWRTHDWGPDRAPLFFYLLMSCHAGLVRYGPNGFNASYKIFLAQGRSYDLPERLRSCAHVASRLRTEPENRDALDVIKDYWKNCPFDVIFADPPYHNSAASSYTNGDWNIQKLLELEELLSEMSKRHGILGVITYFDCDDLTKHSGSMAFGATRLSFIRSTKNVSRLNRYYFYGSRPGTLDTFL